MKRVFLITAAALVAIFIACAGCTEDKPAVATQVPTTETVVLTEVPTEVPTTTREPVVTLPPNQDIDLQLTKDRTYSKIYLLYDGGGGGALHEQGRDAGDHFGRAGDRLRYE